MKCDRRSFFKKAVAGLAVTSVGGLDVLRSESSSSRTNEERQKLIAEANFGLKKPATSKKGMAICSHPLATREAVNILDFGIPIEESVNRPRFGGSYIDPGNMVEADFNVDVRKKAEMKGVAFNIVNPWNWNHGAFEGISIDPATGILTACGDPRRCSKAEGV